MKFAAIGVIGRKRKMTLTDALIMELEKQNPCNNCKESAFSTTCRCDDKKAYDCMMATMAKKKTGP